MINKWGEEMKQEKLAQQIEQLMNSGDITLPPKPHRNYIQNWWFDAETIRGANEKGQLLTLDIDVGKYCDMACNFCFATTQSHDKERYVTRTTERVKQIIDEGIKLGLKTIKIIGAGEPFLFRGLFDIVSYAKNKGVGSLIFTSGHIIGDDNYAKKVFRRKGITSGRDIAERLAELETSVVVKYLTFDDNLHQKLVRPKKSGYPYSKMRDQGLLNLISAGLNQSRETRIGVDCLLLQENYKEARDLFSFFNNYNIFVFMNTPIDCGATSQEFENPVVSTKKQAQQAAESIYEYCQVNKIPFDEVSPYFGAPACSQLNHGLFIGDNKEVRACPGGPVIGTYSLGGLVEVWKNNSFRKAYQGKTCHKCLSRHNKTLFPDYEERVMEKLDLE